MLVCKNFKMSHKSTQNWKGNLATTENARKMANFFRRILLQWMSTMLSLKVHAFVKPLT